MINCGTPIRSAMVEALATNSCAPARTPGRPSRARMGSHPGKAGGEPDRPLVVSAAMAARRR